MHSRTGSKGIAVLVPLSISISISIRKIDIVEQYLYIFVAERAASGIGLHHKVHGFCLRGLGDCQSQ
jgi:hypothetical protein